MQLKYWYDLCFLPKLLITLTIVDKFKTTHTFAANKYDKNVNIDKFLSLTKY